MRLIAPVILLAAALVFVVALDRPRPRADFVIGNGTDHFTLDPQRMSYQHDVRAARALFETLVSIEDGRIVPAAASSWERSKDGLTWTFHLRPEAKWSNGDPVRASDFVYAWRRLILPESSADYTGFLMSVEGAEEFFKWRNESLAAYAAGEWTPSSAADSASAPAPESRAAAATAPESRAAQASPAAAAPSPPAALAPSAAPRSPAAAEALWRETLDRFDRTVGISAPDDHTLVVRLARPVHFWLDLCAFP
ncbi:MAG: hypothetical protein FJ253_11700, partial [Phycisphaerae bacterium]|nr:hypothetical protein [Phycisphaerae bacterium]